MTKSQKNDKNTEIQVTGGDLYDLFQQWIEQDADARSRCQLRVDAGGGGRIINFGDNRSVYVFRNKDDAVTWFNAVLTAK